MSVSSPTAQEPYLLGYLDGALLIDLWPGPEVPEPMRAYCSAVIAATFQAPIPTEYEVARSDMDIRRTTRDVVRDTPS